MRALMVAVLACGCVPPASKPDAVAVMEGDDGGTADADSDAVAAMDGDEGVTADADSEGGAVIVASHLDLSVVERISRFRSGYGHDSSDSFETCRSMKHYFCMQGCLTDDVTPWEENVVYSPVTGTIVVLEQEMSFGIQVRIQPHAASDLVVRVFHVTPDGGLKVGDDVIAGQRIGQHATSATMSDLAVEQYLDGGYRLLSAFDLMSDELLAQFAARGATREELIITADERDANPLSCDGEAFTSASTLTDWVDLDP